MKQIIEKIGKVGSLIRIRRLSYNDELNALNMIRKEKNNLLQSMKASQRKYLDGVEELNKIRSSLARSNQENMENSVDYLKNIWFSQYKMFKDIEQRESIQLKKFLDAEKNLKSLEKLSDNLRKAVDSEFVKMEQSALDEYSITKNQKTLKRY